MFYTKDMPELTQRDKERFWSKVLILGEDDCWNWLDRLVTGGYGRFYTEACITIRSNRLAYYIEFGIDPKNNLVCHSCDNRRCCNPKHLFLGNHGINIRDSVKKRRHVSVTHLGERRGCSKLKEFQVKEILYKRNVIGYAIKTLAEDYNVTRSNIEHIINKKTWKHIQ